MVANLRARAAGLRAVAGRLDGAPLHALDAASGESTWFGPVAAAFDAAVRSHQRAIGEAAEELRWEAWLLERRAENMAAELAAAAALASEAAS